MILSLGESVADDDFFIYFTGNYIDIHLVPAKPSRINIWFYELCFNLRNRGQYSLYSRSRHEAEYISIADVVNYWATIVQRCGYPQTLVIMDSYYLDNISKNVIQASGVKFVTFFTSN